MVRTVERKDALGTENVMKSGVNRVLRRNINVIKEPYDRAEFTGHSHGNVVLAVCV
jgi:hypothetical protein